MVTGSNRGAIAAIGVTLVLTLVSYAVTPALTFNEGFGYLDGQSYGAMARTFRTGEHYDILAPYAFRVLPPALVAWSGLPYRTGFLLLNLLAYFFASVALFALLTRYRRRLATVLVLIAWWAMLPAGIRLAFFYPVLGDGVGTAFLYLLLFAAVADLPVWFATALTLGVLTRENLVTLIPFYAIARGTSSWKITALNLVLVSAPALLLLLWVRVAQPIPAANGVSTVDDAVRNWNWFLQNANERAWRFAAAPPLTLGMFFVLPLLQPRRSFSFLRAHPEWAYYIAVSLALAPIGGGDFDRFAFVLLPALAVIVAATVELSRARALAYSVLHVLAVRFVIPTQPDEASYIAFNVATMDLPRLTILVWIALFIVLLTWVLGRRVLPTTARDS